MKKTVFTALGLGALGVLALAAAPASAKPYPAGGVTAKEVAAVLQAKGYKAEVTRDDSDDPLVKSAADGVDWSVYFYNCTNDRCESIQFSAGFDLEHGITYSKANEWNYTKRFGRAALDDEMDPYIRYDIDAEKGASSEQIELAVDTWLLVLPQFVEFVGFKP
ncbi:YbjN domain-containing protein [Caulobacter mirabilis]|uniref:YbjN domain-containing protein n=1 Tax=Caulobacter mirabilis TaxID=69666 RepID=A0A2D2AWC8_9CAUL|nr:YbjN domain-containing protein [Caulobacter mirabilis]ATQ42275.1 YbjN domain-containing protein [Caulobacter mirabilis]